MNLSNTYKCPICEKYFLTQISTTEYQKILECYGCSTIVMVSVEEIE